MFSWVSHCTSGLIASIANAIANVTRLTASVTRLITNITGPTRSWREFLAVSSLLTSACSFMKASRPCGERSAWLLWRPLGLRAGPSWGCGAVPSSPSTDSGLLICVLTSHHSGEADTRWSRPSKCCQASGGNKSTSCLPQRSPSSSPLLHHSLKETP